MTKTPVKIFPMTQALNPQGNNLLNYARLELFDPYKVTNVTFSCPIYTVTGQSLKLTKYFTKPSHNCLPVTENFFLNQGKRKIDKQLPPLLIITKD